MSERIFKYLYLDDNDETTREGDVELINKIGRGLTIIPQYPFSWKQRADALLVMLKEIDGLILDWEFTNKSEEAKKGSEQAEDVDFSAESLAEHLRINIARNGLKDIPIILCSADKNKAFTILRNKELTSRDLFDQTYLKSDLFDKGADLASVRLYDLASVYSHLQEKKFELASILGVSKGDLESIDIRFIDALENIAASKTIHDLVNFLLKEFIEPEGLLVNERVLAARLGVHIDVAGEWQKLLKILEDAQVIYHGVLSGGWRNYWSFKIENWWSANISQDDLRSLSADLRVKQLNQVLKLNLQAAAKLKFCSSDEFWTVCVGLKKPLDPSNGFIVGDNLCNPWIENQYVSALGELEKNDSSAWRINIMDRERYNQFKTLILK